MSIILHRSRGGNMSKISHVVIENVLYDVNKLPTATLKEFADDVARADLNKVLKNPRYKEVIKGEQINI